MIVRELLSHYDNDPLHLWFALDGDLRLFGAEITPARGRQS